MIHNRRSFFGLLASAALGASEVLGDFWKPAPGKVPMLPVKPAASVVGLRQWSATIKFSAHATLPSMTLGDLFYLESDAATFMPPGHRICMGRVVGIECDAEGRTTYEVSLAP